MASKGPFQPKAFYEVTWDSPPAQAGPPRAVSRWVLEISKDGDGMDGIIASLRLEKTSKIIKSKPQPNTTMPTR